MMGTSVDVCGNQFSTFKHDYVLCAWNGQVCYGEILRATTKQVEVVTFFCATTGLWAHKWLRRFNSGIVLSTDGFLGVDRQVPYNIEDIMFLENLMDYCPDIAPQDTGVFGNRQYDVYDRLKKFALTPTSKPGYYVIANKNKLVLAKVNHGVKGYNGVRVPESCKISFVAKQKAKLTNTFS